MEYLLVMSLSGTTVVCTCILIRHLSNDRICARLQYLLLKISVLYYLIPLPFLKEWYKEAFMDLTGTGYHGIKNILPRWSYYIIQANGQSYLNTYMKLQTRALSIWVLAAAVFFVIILCDYVRTGKIFINYINSSDLKSEIITVGRGRKFIPLIRKAVMYQEVPDKRIMTYGVFHPVILCGLKAGSREEEIVLEHELTHIRRLDVLWKILVRLVMILHWWNPAVWFLSHYFERVCECSCDEVVLQGKTKEEIKEYLILLVNESKGEGIRKEKTDRIRWSIGLKGEAEKLKERIDNAMNRKRWNKVAGLLITTAVMIMNSLTVFAYPEVYYEENKGEVTEAHIEKSLNMDLNQFIPDDASEEELKRKDIAYEQKQKKIIIMYDNQFTDTDGNIYPLQDTMTANVYGNCSHTYVSGTMQEHSKNSDGSCVLITYSAKRCSKCGHVVKGNVLSEFKYTTCPH